MASHHHVGHRVLPSNHYVQVDVAGTAFETKNVPMHHSALPYPPVDVAQSKGAELVKSLWADTWKSEHRLRAAASAAGVLAVEVIGVTRLPSILAYWAAAKLQKETGIPMIAGIGAGIPVGMWGYVVARTLNSGINNLSRTFEAATGGDTIAAAGDISASLLPGLEPESKQDLGTRFARGAAVNATGIGLYVATAGQRQQSPSDRKKLCKNLGIDGGLFLGLTATALTGLSAVVEKYDPETAANILNAMENKKLLFAGLIGFTAVSLARKKLLQRKHRRRMEPGPSRILATEGE